MITRKIILPLMATCFSLSAYAQQEMPLYPDSVVNSRKGPNKEVKTDRPDGGIGYTRVSVPTVQIFKAPADKANGAAMVVCPGGGYSGLAYTKEGINFAKRLNEMGVTAIVLKYRMPNDTTMWDRSIGPLQDAQQAIRLVRQHAAAWKIDVNRVGLMGSSAGGHLAATAGTHFKKSYIPNSDQVNLRPDFLVLVYPVISMVDSITHRGSRNNLIGNNPSAEKVQEFSNELQVTGETPPTFLVHASDDKAVVVDNSINFYSALIRNKVPAELHVYQRGGHGFGMSTSNPDEHWLDRLENWLRDNGWLKRN
ncbi:Acetyl esterase/lipase [Chitinophaga jiangningensis]|uniref:Acetyl esterase/lipase n=1 Tax=Chitinophaga jiangningensis TaxID=1419482 RepID=A0A1M7JS28_9BACT|nr:alpha/beta hydrolase [Chitinophaga jiangningensis]SHM55816.1 Acetyl esterase/lipase [Chitinophaga jiangningensis]